MSPTSYAFASQFDVGGAPSDVHEVLLDLESYPEWWPQVRAVASLGPDDALVVCRSALPYDLELHLTARSRSVSLLEVGIDGALQGYARWRLSPSDAGTTLAFAQEVSVASRTLAVASYLARRVLRWNHAVMMRGCEHGLARRLTPPRFHRP